MSVTLARIDDRLIHGQVIHGWMPRLKATVIIVADHQLATHPQEQEIARLAVPSDVEVQFIEPNELPAVLADEARQTVVLFRTPVDALVAIEHGFHPEALNLGNLHFESGKIQIRKTFCCSDSELAALRQIRDQGVELAYQPAPDLKRHVLDLETDAPGS